MEHTMQVIARIKSDYPEKFGIPRQSGLVDGKAVIIFEPQYRCREAFKGLDGYSHIWLLWEFSEAVREPGQWSPMVHPPRLGGSTQMGVFATRSPFRPNPLGLSSVRLDGIEFTRENGPVLHISGADLMDGTPIYDIKPYLAYTDSHPNAKGGFSDTVSDYALEVDFPPALLSRLPAEKHEAVMQLLAQDPRPSYQHDPERIYGTAYAGKNIRFRVNGITLTVIDVEDYNDYLRRK